MFDIRVDDLSGEATRSLLIQHLRGMQETSPPGNVFALDLAGLKSMRTDSQHLRKGVAAALLQYVIGVARGRGLRRLSLESGSGPAFEPALALYRRRGFVDGEAFAGYVCSDFNQFLHLAIC